MTQIGLTLNYQQFYLRKHPTQSLNEKLNLNVFIQFVIDKNLNSELSTSQPSRRFFKNLWKKKQIMFALLLRISREEKDNLTCFSDSSHSQNNPRLISDNKVKICLPFDIFNLLLQIAIICFIVRLIMNMSYNFWQLFSINLIAHKKAFIYGCKIFFERSCISFQLHSSPPNCFNCACVAVYLHFIHSNSHFGWVIFGGVCVETGLPIEESEWWCSFEMWKENMRKEQS